jgi:phage-related protein/predicted XRE-type DNA-binding protein
MSNRKPVEWIGSSRDDLRKFPQDVRRVMGQAIDDAQLGGESPAAKALKGFGGRGVLEVVDDFDGDTYRAVYTVKFAGVVYVLHAFQKKIQDGHRDTVARDRLDHDASETRRRTLPSQLHERRRTMTGKIAVKRGSGNVFADLGFDRPEEELLKAQLVREIRDIVKRRRLTQGKAATLLGLKQPDVSMLIAGRVNRFSLERLLRCVRRLDRDVTIVIGRKRTAHATRQHRQSAAA